MASTATITAFGLQDGTDRTLYVSWYWNKKNTKNYKVRWDYETGDKDNSGNLIWFIGNESETEDKQATYNAPANARRVKLRIKPLAKTRKVRGKQTAYWTVDWSTAKIHDFDDDPPLTPPVPTVKIDKYQLTATLDNLNVNADSIEFHVYKDNARIVSSGTAKIVTFHAAYTCTVDAGGEYKVQCRSWRDGKHSEWSNYSENQSTIPAAPKSITTCRANSDTSVYLEWPAAKTATTYDVEYATKKEYFDGSDQTTSKTGVEFTHYEVTGLESGQEYFFRVRATNSAGSSPWSEIRSVVVGKDPAAPTTWSSTTTVVTGELLNLYWVHNAEDGSSQTYAEVELIIDGVKETRTVENSTEEDEKDKTSVYPIDTSKYVEGTKIQWRVRTAGITKAYGEWSIERTVDIYAPATLELSVTDASASVFDALTTFPFYVHALPGPNTQAPVGYHLAVTANESYETVDDIGNTKFVNKGDAVYSKYFDTNETLLVEFSAGNIDLVNNVSYTVTCIVSMNSGLTAKSSKTFTVAWAEVEYEPNAEIGIDDDNYVAYIRPYCEDDDGNAIEDVTLSVYRREFDGTFTELATNIVNGIGTFITDPHPALDYARYRIVATDVNTGAVSYYDVPGYPVGGTAAIIQWAEQWSRFDTDNEDEVVQPSWSGSMLKLPYNIDVSDSRKPDVSQVEYIGRRHPVTYYGTQVGESSSWSMTIDKNDKETLYALRRLSVWMGDVYVREPSGSGYWASITVSFNQKHCDPSIPVTLDIIRVEGGV